MADNFIQPFGSTKYPSVIVPSTHVNIQSDLTVVINSKALQLPYNT